MMILLKSPTAATVKVLAKCQNLEGRLRRGNTQSMQLCILYDARVVVLEKLRTSPVIELSKSVAQRQQIQ